MNPETNRDRTIAFINSFDRGNSPFLYELEKYCKREDVPLIRKQTQSLIRFLLASHKPSKILEIGAAVGFSSIFMSECLPSAHITTIENYEKRIPIAKENIHKAGKDEAITLLEGDAGLIIADLTGPYDMIFLDGPKGQYIHYLPQLLRLLRKGGILLTDNVLQDGDLIESRFAVCRRDRTIHARMREYLYEITHTDALETVILSDADGMSLSVRL